MKGILLGIIAVLQLHIGYAGTGREAWLRYAPLNETARAKYASLPAGVFLAGDSAILGNARSELIRGFRGMLGRTLRAEKELPKEPAIILGTAASLRTNTKNTKCIFFYDSSCLSWLEV